jgi:hypothetical protein
MTLADRIAQCHTPFIVQNQTDGHLTRLNNTAEFATEIGRCPIRYVLQDDLTRMCADLAYSKGARTVICADLLRVPAETLWIEWCNEPWQSALQIYGFPLIKHGAQWVGRRGVLIHGSRDGRRGILRTFWDVDGEQDVLASNVEAYFDFDTAEGDEPEPPTETLRSARRVTDQAQGREDVLGRCFRFRYERTWQTYYEDADVSASRAEAIWRDALGTIAMDVPMLLAFFLLLATRGGLPQRSSDLTRLNRRRRMAGRNPLLDHVEVRAPIVPDYRAAQPFEYEPGRRHPRLHHVRGHLVRRGSQIFWRVPHLRGSARAGAVRTRTVVWTFDGEADAAAGRRTQSAPHRRAPAVNPRSH